MERLGSIQKFASKIGESGCYFLSIVRAGERIIGKPVDIITLYVDANNAGILGTDCYVYDPPLLLEMITGTKWTVEKKPRDYKASPGEIVILRFERQTTMETVAHFVLAGEDGSVEYDPYGNSLTVSSGLLASKRILRRRYAG